MDRIFRFFPAVLCAAIALCVLVPAVAFADGSGAISELALAYGDEELKTLEENGYTVMGRPLTGDVWLGYKRGGAAVTGLVVSNDSGDTVTVNGISYQRVGSLGDAGSLYFTRDEGAGTAVLSLSLQSKTEYVDQPFLALRNDGTVPMLRAGGEPCDLGTGQTVYLFLLRENVFRPYIKSVTVVSGNDLRSAVNAAAAAGCDWYYDPDLKAVDGKTVVIGYVRTVNESEAITCLAAGAESPDVQGLTFDPAGDTLIAGEVPYRLFQTHDRSAGNPVIGLTGSAVPVRSTDVMSKWAEKVFVRFNATASSVNQVKSEELYRRFLSDSGALTNVPVLIPSLDGHNVTPLAYVCRAEGQPGAIFPGTVIDTQTPVQTETKEPDEENYLEQMPELIADDDAVEDTAASVFGGGTAAGFIIAFGLAALGAAGGCAAAAVKKRRSGAEEKHES